MNIKIKENTYELKNSFRAYMIYENIQGKSFAPQTLTDVLVFFYATILASTKKLDFSWEDFLDYIDENPSIVTEFSNWLTKVNGITEEISDEPIEKGGEQVKKN